MSVARPTRPWALRPGPVALALALLLVVIGGCTDEGDDGGDPSETTATTAGGPERSLKGRIARACSEVINARSLEVSEAGSDAGLELVQLATRGGAPTDEQRADLIAALEAHRAQLVEGRDALADVEVPAEAEAAWSEVPFALTEVIDLVDTRLEVLADDDWTGAADRIGRQSPPADSFTQALVDLGLGRGDCEVVPSHPGVPDEDADFVRAGASACTTVVARRIDGPYADDADRSFEVLEAVVEGRAVTVDDDLIDAIDRLRIEWETSADDLRDVPAREAPAPGEWEALIGSLEEGAATFADRVEALRSGDQGEIAAAWDPATAIGGSGADLAVLGLDQRDCRRVVGG